MPQRPRLRSLAAFVLLLWLLGLGSSVVHACVTASGLRHAAHMAAMAAAQDHGGATAAHQMEMGGGEQDAADCQTPCEQLCDEPAAPSQADKLQGGSLSGLWLAVASLPAVLPWPAADPATAPPRAEVLAWAAVPIPIAYLRLTL